MRKSLSEGMMMSVPPENTRDSSTMEREKIEAIDSRLAAMLREHIMEVHPSADGNRGAVLRMKGSAFGVEGTTIERCLPPLTIKNVRLDQGKALILVGPNGAGKSTFMDAIMERGNADLNTQSGKGAVVYGESIHGRETLRVARLNQEEMLSTVSELTAREVLEQSARYCKEQLPVDWDAEWSEEMQGRNEKNEAAQRRIDELIGRIVKLLDMDDFLDRQVGQLSGGERTKTVLFSILLSEADVLLLDEPTNHLDMESILKLLALFQKYKRSGVSILSVSHVDWFLEEAGHEGVVEINAAREVQQTQSSFTGFMKDKGRTRTPLLAKEIPWAESDGRHDRTLVFQKMAARCTIPDSPLVHVDIPSIGFGEIVFLSGKNGTGKTKVVEYIAEGGSETGIMRQERVNSAYLPQFFSQETTDGTIENFFFSVKQKVNPRCDTTKGMFLRALRDVEFGGGRIRIDETFLRKQFKTLSGGEQRIVWFMAVSSLPNVDVLVLDEPTNHMDRESQKYIEKAIVDFPGAVVIATHDVNLLRALHHPKSGLINNHPKTTNLVFEKKGGKTTIGASKRSLEEYVRDTENAARRAVKQFNP